jgi:hypothetical protein
MNPTSIARCLSSTSSLTLANNMQDPRAAPYPICNEPYSAVQAPPYPVAEQPYPVQPAQPPYPISDAWMVTLTPSSPTTRLVEAAQTGDITREDIARTAAALQPEMLAALSAEFLDVSRGKTSIHRFCAAVSAVDPPTLVRTADLLCNQGVTASAAACAQQAMEEQRMRMRSAQLRAINDESERFER